MRRVLFEKGSPYKMEEKTKMEFGKKRVLETLKREKAVLRAYYVAFMVALFSSVACYGVPSASYQEFQESVYVVEYRRRRYGGGGGGSAGGFKIGNVVELMISLMMIPIITTILGTLSLEGVAGQLITSITPLIPLVMTMDALKKIMHF